MPNQNSKHILLVDDNENDAELALVQLQQCQPAIRVDMAHDGEEALDYLLRRGTFANRPTGEPMVVLLDLKMPKVTGLEVLRAVKSDDKLKSIPIVMLTSSREARDLRECYRLGANGYVVKPVEAHDFKLAMQNLSAFWAATNEPPPQ